MVGEKALAGDFRFMKLLFELNEKFRQRYGERSEPFTMEELKQADEEMEAWEQKHFGGGSSGS
jgi:hypothetical protein